MYMNKTRYKNRRKNRRKNKSRRKNKNKGGSADINTLFAEYKKNRKKLQFSELKSDDCKTKNKAHIAIIIPYRDRLAHLQTFSQNFNKLLDNYHKSVNDKAEITVYVIEQDNDDKFNRGLLLNLGFVIANKDNAKGYDRYIFHDVDMAPNDNTFTYYFCALDKTIHYVSPSADHKYSFENYLGGVLGMTKEVYKKINGYSNKYWGWGGEDDGIYNRLVKENVKVYRIKDSSYVLEEHEQNKDLETNKKEKVLKELTGYVCDGVKECKERVKIVKGKLPPGVSSDSVSFKLYKVNFMR